MKLINKLSFIFILFANFCFSQEHKFMSYPHFDEADLNKTHSLIDKNAPAEILYNSVSYNIFPEFSVEKKYFSKIKIYDKKNSEDWLNIEIPVIDGETISDFEVNVYNKLENKVEKITINKRDQLKENFVKGLKFYKVAIPNILDGSVIEYYYKILSNNIFNLNYNLQYNIPVIYQEYSLEHPESITYNFNNTGNYIKPQYNYSDFATKLTVPYKIYRFGYDNMKPIQKELFVKNSNKYRSVIKPELKKYSNQYFTYDIAENWNKVAERLNNSDRFGGYLRNNVRELLPDVKTFNDPFERANKIFEFVKNNYKWNKKYGIMTSQSIKQLSKSKSGNAADINLLLIALLRNAGFQSDPILISTVDNGILNILSPNVNNLNMVLASVKINNQIYFFDATSISSMMNTLPERDWNDFGILIQDDNGTDFSYVNTNISKKNLIINAKIDIENSEITGTFTQNENGLYAIESYDEFDENKDKYNQSFKTEFNTNMKEVQSILDDKGNFKSEMKFSTNNLIDVVGNKIILNPLLFLNSGNEVFDQKDERKNQIDFISAFTREKKVEIEIPHGYKVIDLPKPKKIQTDDKEITYLYKVEFVNNKLSVISKVEVASQNYPKEYYVFFKQIWRIITESENQVISLIKN